jgi:hypothetical protein
MLLGLVVINWTTAEVGLFLHGGGSWRLGCHPNP